MQSTSFKKNMQSSLEWLEMIPQLGFVFQIARDDPPYGRAFAPGRDQGTSRRLEQRGRERQWRWKLGVEVYCNTRTDRVWQQQQIGEEARRARDGKKKRRNWEKTINQSWLNLSGETGCHKNPGRD